MDDQNNKDALELFISDFNKKLTVSSENIELPSSLRSENLFVKHDIPKQEPVKVQGQKNGKRYWMQMLAYAACFVLIFTGYYQVSKIWTPQSTSSIPEDPLTLKSSPDTATVAEDYSQIRSAIENVNNNSANTYKVADEANSPLLAAPRAPQMETASPSTGAGKVYQTNTQVGAVDEADIVKTDGEYIYHYRHDDGAGNAQVSIVEAEDLKVVSFIPLTTSQSTELYLYNNNLVIIENLSYETANEVAARVSPVLADIAPDNNEKKVIVPDYIQDRRMNYNNVTMTKAVIYNIADKSKPLEVHSLVQDGEYISSRIHDEQLYLVTNKTSSSVVYDTMPAREIIPIVSNNNTTTLMPPEDIIISPYMGNANYAVISAVNLVTNKTITKAVLGVTDTIMVSEKSMYITSTIRNQNYGMSDTGIVKFDLNKGDLKYVGSGKVSGSIENQFSLDEYSGNLRVTTTSYKQGTTQNNLFVLDKNLKQIGALEGLAPEERIYATRFMGDTAYVVTFKQIDPLFVIDLSNPTKPTVTGELKIPGFSEYLHPIGNGKLVGFGVNTITTKYGGVQQDGLKLSMFDVKDPRKPTEEFTAAIGNTGTHSEALYNHKAFLYYPEKKLIGFPANIMTAGDSQVAFDGYLLFKIEQDQFKLTVKIPSGQNSNDIVRSNPNNSIQRAVYIGDVLYTVANGRLMSYSLTNFQKLNMLSYE